MIQKLETVKGVPLDLEQCTAADVVLACIYQNHATVVSYVKMQTASPEGSKQVSDVIVELIADSYGKAALLAMGEDGVREAFQNVCHQAHMQWDRTFMTRDVVQQIVTKTKAA